MKELNPPARVERGPAFLNLGPVPQILTNVLKFVEETVPAVLMAAMVILVVVDVFGRYAFSRPIEGTAELATSMFLGVIFLGAAGAMRRRLHVNIDLFVVRLPRRWQAAVLVLTNLVLAAGLLVLVPVAWTYAIENRRMILLLNLPQKYILTVIAVGYLLIALHALTDATRVLVAVFRDDVVLPEADDDFGVSEDMTPIFAEDLEPPRLAEEARA